MKKYDAIMIGFGKGAKTLAGKLAAGGSKVAMIEKRRWNVRRHLHQRGLYSF